MIVVVAGGRNFTDETYARIKLNEMHYNIAPTLVIQGGCMTGADMLVRDWAKSFGVPCATFHANWRYHGRAAGPIRNRSMAKVADVCMIFPGGRGTSSMKTAARKNGLKVIDYSNYPGLSNLFADAHDDEDRKR